MKKWLGIAAIVIIAIIVIAVVLIVANKDKLINKAVDRGFGRMETAILEDLPGSIPADSVTSLVAEAKAAAKSREADAHMVSSLMVNFRSCYEDGSLDSLEISELLDMMEKARGDKTHSGP